MSTSLSSLAPITPWGAVIFCRVVDNMGDAGVCWRLAKRLSALGWKSLLVIDDPAVLARMVPLLDAAATRTGVVTVTGESPESTVGVLHWDTMEAAANAGDLSVIGGVWPRLVLETFGCRLPEAVETGLDDGRTRLWMNLEYLSAEDYAEECHRVWGFHPRLSVKKLWFYPGFTEKTGGLLFSPQDVVRQNRLLTDVNTVRERRAALGVEPGLEQLLVFTYPSLPLEWLVAAMKALPQRIAILLAPGAAGETLAARLREETSHQVISLPYLSQDDFDEVIWTSDLAIIRGEESFVRAQLGGTPFVWSIYPTEDFAHEVKLDAWLARFGAAAVSEKEREAFAALSALTHAWLAGVTLPAPEVEKQRYRPETDPTVAETHFVTAFLALWERKGDLKHLATHWREQLLSHGDLATAIVAEIPQE